MTEPSDPIPAATLVVFRDCADGPPELLMVERARGMAFAGGALVFPGGRIDPGDHVTVASEHADSAARVAAIRETIEEAGMPIALHPPPGASALAAIRAGLHAGQPFGRLLAEHGLTLELSQLVLFARWLPRHAGMRIFDTLFYLAALPPGSPDPVVDATENSRVFWATAQSVLDDADAGRSTIIFPTRRNLERLATFGSFSDAVTHARSFPPITITPWTEERDGVAYLCIAEGAGYPVTAEPVRTAMRG